MFTNNRRLSLTAALADATSGTDPVLGVRVDDHDQVRKWTAKRRFCGDSRYRDLAFNVMAAQLTTAGIPCIYYGSEQGLDQIVGHDVDAFEANGKLPEHGDSPGY